MAIDRIPPKPYQDPPSPRMLLVALGNSLRHDDGVAANVLSLVSPRAGVERRIVLQPLPELAAELIRFDDVVFVDADTVVEHAVVEPLIPGHTPGVAIGHSLRPGEVVTLARHAFGFTGRAWLCRVPAHDFSAGEGLGEDTEAHAREAAAALHEAFPASLGYAGAVI